MKKRYLAYVLFALGTAAWIAAALIAERQQTSISSRVIRLHVIAASDSEVDQQHKLLVRDAVLACMAQQGCRTERAPAVDWRTSKRN